MRKFFTLIVMFGLANIVHAQVLQLQKHIMEPVAKNNHRAIISPGANQNWWGYVDNESGKNSVGITKTDTYHCAIFIPGDHVVARGKTIHAIRTAI